MYAWTVAERRLVEGSTAAMAEELGCAEKECQDAVDVLLARHVLIAGPAGVVAASPDVAIAALVGPRESAHREVEQELMAERGRTAQLRARLAALAPVYSDHVREGATNGVDTITDMHAVRALIADLTATCETEIMACQPGADGRRRRWPTRCPGTWRCYGAGSCCAVFISTLRASICRPRPTPRRCSPRDPRSGRWPRSPDR
ncbi:hypothetical protein ACFQ9X_55085 [Catenulispora yoronensis]